jgi:hypothetical protein
MAYVPGCEHDVFVSYAHLDNEPMAASECGWVDALAERLQIEVSQRLGTRDFKLWIDHHLDGNHPITPEILTAIRQSATLLVVMSPSYLNSLWCRRERTAFLELIKDRAGSGRVFVVFAREVPRKDVPPEFGDLEGFRFWIQDEEARADRPLGVPDLAERAYITKLLQLSHDLKKQLEQLKAAGELPQARSVPTTTSSPDGTAVFVARSTDDLEEREDELKSYLSQAGIAILPQTRYPQDNQGAFAAAMRQDLAKCKAFVQLLSGSRGRELEFATPIRYPRLQHDIAVEAGTPRLLWRDRALDMDAVRDAEHRVLLESARACGMEEFKRAVLEEARRSPEPTKPSPLNVMVFVNAEAKDRELAQSIGKALMQEHVECYFPLASGSPEAIRRDLEENLGNCDGVLLIYGSSDAEWVRSQLRQGRKVISQRERPLNGLAVYEGPPFSKEDLGVAIPNLVLLDCREGFDTAKLGEFVATLRK